MDDGERCQSSDTVPRSPFNKAAAAQVELLPGAVLYDIR